MRIPKHMLNQPHIAKLQYLATMTKAEEREREFEVQEFRHETEHVLLVMAGKPSIQSLGFQLDNGSYLSEAEATRIANAVNTLLMEIYEARDTMAKELITS